MPYQVALTIDAPVREEAVDDLKRLLAIMGDGVANGSLIDFGALSGVHFARLMKADPVEVAGWIIKAARKGAGSMTVKFIVTLGRHFSAKENAPSVDAALEHRKHVVAAHAPAPPAQGVGAMQAIRMLVTFLWRSLIMAPRELSATLVGHVRTTSAGKLTSRESS